MTKKILVATDKPFAKEAVEQMKAELAKTSGYEMTFLEKYGEQSKLKEAVKGVDALIIRSDKADKDVIGSADNLKVIVRAGAGYDNIDLAAATAKNVVAMNTPGQNSNAVAELALSLMIMAARNNYNGKPGSEISGKKLGIAGLGAIGKIIAKYAKGFGMEAYACKSPKRDAKTNKEIIESEGLKYCASVEDVFAACNYVSLHIPATDQTKNSINFDVMSKMPKPATLINTARKELICEDGLKKMLAERPDFKYMTDVAPSNAEELKAVYPDRFFCTPKKLGAQTAEANINAGVAAVRQIVAFFEKGDKTFQVNK